MDNPANMPRNRNFQLIGFMLGLLLLILGSAMLVPAWLDWKDDHHNAAIFLHGALISWFIGGSLTLANRGPRHPLNIREAYVLTLLAWCAAGLIAAIPLWLSDLDIDFTDALFESVSGITTTGASIITGLETASRGVLLWRSMTQMFGGTGIILFVIILLPMLRIGGMQLFQSEGNDSTEKALPRTEAAIKSLLSTYFILCALCAVTYYAGGMSGFDAINHAFTTISTGGFSTRENSFAAFNSGLQLIALIYMIMAALPFILYVRLFRQNEFTFHQDPQVRIFLLLLLALTALLTIDTCLRSEMQFFTALRHSAFNLASILSTTGFSSTDYQQWGPFAVALFFFITYLGACAGSTAGGIKMMRVVIAIKSLGAQFKRLIFPHGTFVITYDNHAVPPLTVLGVLGFLFVYVAANTMLTVGLSFTGLDFTTALSAAAAAIANVGPGVGPVLGPAGSYATLSDPAKWMLCAGMIVGRLEIMTALVLFTPAFWQK